MRRILTIPMLLAAALVIAGPARAQNTAAASSAVDLDAVNAEIRDMQEDILLLRIMTALKMTDSQLQKLLPSLQSAQEKLNAQDEADSRELKGRQPGLEGTLRQALAGNEAATRAEDDYQRLLETIATRRSQLRAQLAASLQRTLASVATSDQLAAMSTVGDEMAFIQQQLDWTAQANNGQGGGPLGGMARRLDRIRDMSPGDFERMRAQAAGFGGRGGGPGGGGGRGGGPGGFGGRRGRGGAMGQVMGQIGEQVRSMPAEQYSAQRLELAADAFKQMRNNFRPPDQQDPQVSLQTFIERYLLSSRIVPAIKEKLANPAPPAAAAPAPAQ